MPEKYSLQIDPEGEVFELPRMPKVPQIDLTFEEEGLKSYWIDTLNGKPLGDYNFTCMRVFATNIPQEASESSEFQVCYNSVRENLNSNPYIAAPTNFIVDTRQLYWGGYVNIRDGNIWGMSSALTNPKWRTNIISNANPEGMFDELAIRNIQLKSVIKPIPVGTNVKIWLC